MKKIPQLILLSSLTLAGPVLLVSPAFSDDGGKGKKEFVSQGCNKCHAVSTHEIEATVKSEKMRGPDLAKVGAEHDASWIAQFVKKEVQLDGKDHRSPWKGNDEQLQAIADWLATLE